MKRAIKDFASTCQHLEKNYLETDLTRIQKNLGKRGISKVKQQKNKFKLSQVRNLFLKMQKQVGWMKEIWLDLF